MRRAWTVKRFLLKLKSVSKKAILSFPKTVECNICGWAGRHFFSTSWHPYTLCPRCYSQVRHRLLVASLSYIEQLSFENIVLNKRVLHFAPEDMLKSTLQTYAGRYLAADLMGDNVDIDMTLDISHMPEIDSDYFDVVIACDVLEHVENDIEAIHEIHRILSSGGHAILTVPQKDNLDKTFQDPTILNPKERELYFGQSDHLRIYGNDFPALLESAGFKVTIVNESSFSDEMVKKHVLFPSVLSKMPLATNYRKIFFARKV